MTELVTDKCPCCGTRGLNPKKIKDMCENCLETSFDQWRRKVVSLEKENAELKAQIENYKMSESESLEIIAELKAQIKKMICCDNCKFSYSRKDEEPCSDCDVSTDSKWELAE